MTPTRWRSATPCVWYNVRMAARVLLTVLALVALACGSPAPASTTLGGGSPSGAAVGAEPREPDPATSQDLDPSDPSLEVDPQVCATDADCVIGTPRDCCNGLCPEHRVAWSRAAWAAFQYVCSIVECARPESPACEPENDRQPAPTVACVRERCVLR